MNLFKLGDASPSARMTFLSVGVVVFIANCLAGFDNISWVHWLIIIQIHIMKNYKHSK